MGRNNKKPSVSVIIPTCNRYPVLLRNIRNIRKQTHPVEIVVCDDSHIDDYKTNKDIVKEIKAIVDKYHYTALYDHENNKIYGVGRARNKGIIEAKGEFLVFLDDRITPADDRMVSIFAHRLAKHSKHWFFGDKGAQKTSFVENCSAIRRKEIIISGMFSETINTYGFMTRELYARYKKQGFSFVYLKDAKAEPLCSGSRRSDPKRISQIAYSRDTLRKMKLV